ncbi:MAG: 3-keto-5-aminohexanoate cleavage protein, partial [Pseudomonadota bacterium]
AAVAGIRLQHILYDPADIERLRAARAAGLMPQTQSEAIFVLGAYDPPRTGRPGDLAPLLAAAADLDLDLDWAVCAFGPAEHACVTEAMRRGGHARVGFENNTLCPDGRPAEDNAALVALAAQAREAITLQEAHR